MKKLHELEEANKIKDKHETKVTSPRNSGANSKSIKILILYLILCVLFCGYFIFGFVFHIYQLSTLEEIISYSPIFCKRYSDLYLSYGFLREKIIS